MKNPKKKDNTNKIEADNALRIGRITFEEWFEELKVMAKAKRLFLPDFMKHLNVLAARLHERIKVPYLRDQMLEQVYRQLAKTPAFLAYMKFTKAILVHCPHQVTVNNITSDCNWTGRANVLTKDFEAGTAKVKCPSCDREITADNMSDPSSEKERP